MRRGEGRYRPIATLAPGAWQRTVGGRRSGFGSVVRLSHISEYLFVTDENDSGAGHDVLAPPLARGNVATGAVYVFKRDVNRFTLRKVLKPHVVNAPDAGFGRSLAVTDFGKVLAVGHPSERSGASGVDGDRDDTSSPGSGAVWLY